MADLFSGASAQVSPFTFGNHAVRVIVRDGEPWFVVKDVMAALGYSGHSAPAKVCEHIPDEWKGVNPVHTLGGEQKMLCLSEPGLYFFLGRSDKTAAVPFQKWLAGEVVPSIRKTGGYGRTEVERLEQAFALAATAASQVQRTVFEAVLAGERAWQHERMLLSFTYGRSDSRATVPQASVLAHDQFVATLDRLPRLLAGPDGLDPSEDQLATIAAACTQRLAQIARDRGERLLAIQAPAQRAASAAISRI